MNRENHLRYGSLRALGIVKTYPRTEVSVGPWSPMDFAGVFVSFFVSFLFSDNQIIPLIVYCCYFMLLRCNVFQRAWYSALLIKVSGHVRICSIVMNFEGACCSLCFFDKDDEGDGVLWVARGSVNSEIQGCLNSWAALSCLAKDEQGT